MRGRNSVLDERRAAGAERAEDRGERAFEILHGVGAGVEGRERIDQHDLAVEPREMLAIERPHHHVLVGLVAPLHHRPERARARRLLAGQFERREGQRRRAREVARHQEAAGRQQPHGVALVAAGLEIVGEQRARPRARPARSRARAGSSVARWRCQRAASIGARAAARELQRIGRPLRIARGEQRQVEQPFARIVHDVERERAVARAAPRRLILDDEAKLADAAGRLRPAPLVGERAQMRLVVEARHRIVGLRLEPRARDAAARQRLEHRQAPAMQQLMHQRGDEHRLAGAGQAGDAEPDGRIEQAGAEFAERAPRRGGFLP